jgi:hypothetical protein
MSDDTLSDVTPEEFTPFEFRLGRLEKVAVDLAPLHTYFEGNVLPAAPVQCKYALKVVYPLADNDRLGDCVLAGHVHLSQAIAHENDGTYKVPDGQVIQTEYFDLTGGADTGLVESTFLTTAQKAPVLGSQVDVFCPFNHANVDSVKSIIYTFGGVFLGVNLPQSAENQFPGTWTVVPNSPIIGGHCIVAVGYDAQFVYIITWGKVIRCTWEWFTTYVDEAYAILYTEEVQKNRGPLKTLDIERLRADIANINGTDVLPKPTEV